MDFTDLYKQNSCLCEFSPSSSHILIATNDRLIVRLAPALQIIRTWQIDPSPSASATILAKPTSSASPSPLKKGITHIGWSNDGRYVMACLAGRGVVEVRSVREGDHWEARIEAGVEGLSKAEWAPDGRSILCWSDWGLRLSIYSLTTGQTLVIPYPIHPDRAHAFRADGRYLALATRRAGKDMLNIIDAAENWALVRQCPLPTMSISDISVSPDGMYVAVWESTLEYKVHILTLDGRLQHSFSPPPPLGDIALGVRCVSWHPTSGFLAVGGWDEKVYILAKLADWKAVATLDVTTKLSTGCGVNAWREPLGWLEATMHRGYVSYDQASLPLTIPSARPDPAKVPLRSGIAQLEWSLSGRYLLCRSDTTPTALHIFALPPPTLPFSPRLHTVLLHEARVFAARWNPMKEAGSVLLTAGVEGKAALYLWGDEEEWVAEGEREGERMEGVAECCGIPASKWLLLNERSKVGTRRERSAPLGPGDILLCIRGSARC